MRRSKKTQQSESVEKCTCAPLSNIVVKDYWLCLQLFQMIFVQKIPRQVVFNSAFNHVNRAYCGEELGRTLAMVATTCPYWRISHFVWKVVSSSRHKVRFLLLSWLAKFFRRSCLWLSVLTRQQPEAQQTKAETGGKGGRGFSTHRKASGISQAGGCKLTTSRSLSRHTRWTACNCKRIKRRKQCVPWSGNGAHGSYHSKAERSDWLNFKPAQYQPQLWETDWGRGGWVPKVGFGDLNVLHLHK